MYLSFFVKPFPSFYGITYYFSIKYFSFFADKVLYIYKRFKVMIEIPYIYIPVISPITKPAKVKRYANITDDEGQQTEVTTERRKRPTRRTSKRMKQIVNRRVSSDRRKPSFSEKA